MKIYIQYPWKFPDSPYYKYLIDSPPKNIKFLNTKKQQGVITSKEKFLLSNSLKKIIRQSLSLLNLPIPNAHLTKTKQDYDLIHCAHCLSLNKKKPWVADFESLWQVWASGKKTKSGKKIVRKILLKKNCKKIITWTEETKNDFLKEFPEIKNKIEVLYPAVSLQNFKKNKSNKIKIIFSGRYFYLKGGLHTIEAIDKLTKKYANVEGIINGEIPKYIKNKYEANKKIKFYGLIPQKELFDLYSKSDISIYPGYSDSFGFAFLETMSFGIPSITLEGYSKREIIQNNKTGFIIQRPKKIRYNKITTKEQKIIDQLIEKTSSLIENPKLRNQMSENCKKIIEQGKFSIKKRNNKLKKIYEEAIK